MSHFLKMSIVGILVVCGCSSGSKSASMGTVDVFYKERPPSLETLARTDSVLASHGGEYTITRHLITGEETESFIEKYGLPSTHFPFAVVINGNFSALVGEEKIDFVHFPLFMRGIGRHEGNWSMEHLEMVLKDTNLLMEKSVLPVLDDHDDEPCPGEE